MISRQLHSQNFLKEKVWIKESGYYQKARGGSKDVLGHTGFRIINKYLLRAQTILDVGCGEGTKLNILGNKTSNKYGIDISRDAINIASRQYPNIKFKVGSIEKLPFRSSYFDASYCAFVLEHVSDPLKVLQEMIRVTKNQGFVIIICPNFGAPNRHSPCFKGSKIVKLIKGLYKQIIQPGKLSVQYWQKVVPIGKEGKYFPDSDTVIEPEIISLINFIKDQSLTIKYWSSLWNEEIKEAHKMQTIFRFGAKYRIYPFMYWGPQILVIVKKNND